jgi:hypothetical protein
MVNRLQPFLTKIIHQGIREGVFITPYPDYAWLVTVHLLQGMGDEFAAWLLKEEPPHRALQQAETAIAAFNDALERVLGAPAGSIHAMDADALQEWFGPQVEVEQTEEIEVPGL